MNAVENYANLIEGIFGPHAIKFDRKSNHSNDIIGALNNESLYNIFKKNFIERLKRLALLYSSKEADLENIIVLTNQLVKKQNWEGAYAEFVALDHFNHESRTGQPILIEPINTNITLPSNRSLTEHLGNAKVNLDGWIPEAGFYFDVKCLKDNISEILDRIYKELFKHLGIKRGLSILQEYPRDSSYLLFQKERNNLLNELKTKITVKDKPDFVASDIIPGLSYHILWGPGVHSSVVSYDPFAHAQNLHSGIFNYTNKLLKYNPTVIVFVIFPWFNQVISPFRDSNLAFYRSYARRVFCQHIKSEIQYSSLCPAYKGNETVFEVSQHISGIIFLEDNSILGEEDTSIQSKCYTYVNPNSKNPLKHLAKDYLLSITNAMYDDFESDNY